MKNIARYYLFIYLLVIGILFTFFPSAGLTIFLAEYKPLLENCQYVRLVGVLLLSLLMIVLQTLPDDHKTFVRQTLIAQIILVSGMAYTYSVHSETLVLVFIGIVVLGMIFSLLSLKYDNTR